MVALAVGRYQFRIQGSAVTGLSPVDITPEATMTLGNGLMVSSGFRTIRLAHRALH
jgi:hypothetical protein